MEEKVRRKKITVINKAFIEDDNHKLICVYGSRGSGKTCDGIRKIIRHAIKNPRSKNLIVRLSMPSLKTTVVYPLIETLDMLEIPYEYRKTDCVIIFPWGAYIQYRAMIESGSKSQEPERIKSSTFDYIWIEEATELEKRHFDVLMPTLRGQFGTRQMIMTFNPPPSSHHWIYEVYERYEKRKRATRYHYHYSDNPFLPDDFIQDLEALEEYDIGLYKRYTLGEWKVDTTKGLIYPSLYFEYVEDEKVDEWIGGIDFGYNHPTVFLLIGIIDEKTIYVKDGFFMKGVLTKDIIDSIFKIMKKWDRKEGDIPIYCDTAEPDRISELEQAGLLVYPADKSVLPGINTLKSKKIIINPDIDDRIKQQLRNYKWREDKDGKLLDQPVKIEDDAPDALRYAVYTHLSQSSAGVIFI